MKIGIPKEIKTSESRVALKPSDCAQLVRVGHHVVIEESCGVLSGYSDEEYNAVGCQVVDSKTELYQQAELIVKVKEPQPLEYDLLTEKHTLFCYLHLAAEPEVQSALIASKTTAIAFEEVTDNHGGLPLLRPMSMVAGKLAAQYASIYLHSHYAGRGVLVDSLEGADKARVTVLGYGVVGRAAAEHLFAMGAELTIVDRNKQVLADAKRLHAEVTTLNVVSDDIERAVCNSDIVIGAVLVPGARAPIVVKKETVANMLAGSVIVDIAVDQGGCIETTSPTTHEHPTYILHGVTHLCVPNMPAAVPRTATQLISSAILPTVTSIADGLWRSNKNIMAGLCIENGLAIK